MKKQIFGRQFKRDIHERKALFKGLMTSLVMHERIQTTEQKAKSIKGSIEKLVTKAKKQGVAAERLLLPYLPEPAVKKLIGDIAPRFANRPGGYTRIIRVGKRFQDNASVVIIEWVEKSSEFKVQSSKSNKKNKNENVESTAAVETKKDSKQAKKTASKKEDKKETKKTEKKTTKDKKGVKK